MVREIIIPREKKYNLSIPEAYLNRAIEILVVPVDFRDGDNEITHSIENIKRTSGMLKNRIIDPVEWQRSIRSEWDSRS